MTRGVKRARRTGRDAKGCPNGLDGPPSLFAVRRQQEHHVSPSCQSRHLQGQDKPLEERKQTRDLHTEPDHGTRCLCTHTQKFRGKGKTLLRCVRPSAQLCLFARVVQLLFKREQPVVVKIRLPDITQPGPPNVGLSKERFLNRAGLERSVRFHG